jgi:hypothetical protein
MFHWMPRSPTARRAHSHDPAREGDFLTTVLMLASGLPPLTGNPDLDACILELYARYPDPH